MLKYVNLYRIILKTFGFRLRPIATFLLIQLRHLINACTRATDHVIYPRFRKARIDRPVFIIGNPRSGTTFVHRFLLTTQQLCALELWEMILPAITARKIFGGAIDRLAPLSPARYHSADAHETSLRDVETDDLLELFQTVDGAFLWSYFLAWEYHWGTAQCQHYFGLNGSSEQQAQRRFDYLEACWRRNMYVKEQPRVIAKTSIATLGVEALLERFPDCKLIYIVRDPVETIPSGMSLVTGVLERSYDIFNATDPVARSRYLENLYQASCEMYRSFESVRTLGKIPPERLRIVPYPRLMKDLESTMRELIDFIEVQPEEAFFDHLKETARAQSTRKRSHHYALEKFGLTEERIRRDLAFVYENYDV